jgi:peptidyl-prolyl cis-trans isomerase D
MLAKEYFSKPCSSSISKDREKDADLNAKIPMYTTMIKAGVYTTESEGKFKYEMESKK